MTHRRRFHFQGRYCCTEPSSTPSADRSAPPISSCRTRIPAALWRLITPALLLEGAYQQSAVRQMMQKGMTELTGAPGWPDA